MLTFIHTYTEDSWQGLVKNGLWRDGDGLKLMHKPDMPPPYDFNYIAAPGGGLYRRLEELRCPFYVDRLQGGGYIEEYDYDRTLVNAYRELLGEKFLGFQMHEWMSNLFSDLEKMRLVWCTEWTEEGVSAAVRRRSSSTASAGASTMISMRSSRGPEIRL